MTSGTHPANLCELSAHWFGRFQTVLTIYLVFQDFKLSLAKYLDINSLVSVVTRKVIAIKIHFIFP